MKTNEIADGYEALARCMGHGPAEEILQEDRVLTYHREADRLRLMDAELALREREINDVIRHRAEQERLLAESTAVQRDIASALLELAAAVRAAK